MPTSLEISSSSSSSSSSSCRHQRCGSFGHSPARGLGIVYYLAFLCIIGGFAEAKNSTTDVIHGSPPSPPPPPLNSNTTVETLMAVCNNSTQYRSVQNLSVDDEDTRTIAGLVATSFADVTNIPSDQNADSRMRDLIMACNPIVEKAVQNIQVITACQVEENNAKYYIVEFGTTLTCSTTGTPKAWTLQLLALVQILPNTPITILKISVIG